MAERADVFKALADPTRRALLDRLRVGNAATLTELIDGLDMSRQSVTQHLDLLVAAGLVTVVRRGRERLHYLNPTPIHELQSRWLSAFDQQRMSVIDDISNRAEEYAMESTATSIPDYVYVTYIRARPDDVWRALTDPDITAQYWKMRNVSDWQPGSTWQHQPPDDDRVFIAGRVLEADPPTRLVLTWKGTAGPDEGESVVTFKIDEVDAAVIRLTVTHEQLPDEAVHLGISQGWPAVLSNLKSLLETGALLPDDFWAAVHPAAEGASR
jgi:uncharacterized protein YndB with AHSA1/START domain/DNA-binding transcriptional ArsR family regulator